MTTRRHPSAGSVEEPIAAAKKKHRPYKIDIRFLGGLTDTQQAAFQAAAARWGKVIENNQPAIKIGSDRIEGLLISARGATIDGPGNILGQSGPTALRPGSFIPAKASMEFDTADLLEMEHEGTLQDVITHEMGHALGIGSIWDRLGLLAGAGAANPVFTGPGAEHEFAVLLDRTGPQPVSVENTGGPGTADSHWRETVFGNELMTGFIAAEGNPLSRMTVASLQDMGYTINFGGAEPYTLPSSVQLAIMGIHADKPHKARCAACGTRRNLDAVVADMKALLSV